MDNLLETPPGNANCQIEVGGQVGGGQAGIFPVYTEKKESKKNNQEHSEQDSNAHAGNYHTPPAKNPSGWGGGNHL